MMARDILAGLGVVCGTGVAVWMLALGLPAWTLAAPFLVSLLCVWQLARESFR